MRALSATINPASLPGYTSREISRIPWPGAEGILASRANDNDPGHYLTETTKQFGLNASPERLA
jgi:hypothetical protein